jgi:glycine/D-amino acid oxidase-like deaminating enzyme
MVAKADVTIYGAGILGLSLAFELARRKSAVQVIDPFTAPGASSRGVVGALAPHTPDNWNEKKAFQFESLIAARSFWADITEISGQETGYCRFGRLQPILTAAGLQLANERAKTAQIHWQGKADWQVITSHDFGSWAPASPMNAWIFDTLSAHIDPRRAMRALQEAVVRLGVTIAPFGSDEGQVVWATGTHGLEALSNARGRMVGVGVKGQAAVLGYDAGPVPQIFADALHIMPHDNGTVAIGSTSEREFGNPESTDAQLDDLIARAREILPVLKTADVVQRWAGVRPRARSRAPMLGRHPVTPDQFIVNGGFKIGFGMAPKTASVMADLILEYKDTIPKSFRVEASW